MPQTDGTTFFRQLRRLVAAQCPSQLADDELLSQFIHEHDEASFAALVRRHGSMVMGLACNVLHHQQDAEDVFQASFLLLARKANTIRKHQSLGSWLHGVAYRLALKTLAQKSRRKAREKAAALIQGAKSSNDVTVRELRGILHEELNRLPEKYRAPLLLCYWEGKTRDEAAASLGVTANVLKKRLEQARNILGKRLTRRGLAPTVALFTTLLSENGARAAVSSLLIQNTAQAAVAFAAAQPVAVGASTAAVTLAQGAIRMMLFTKCFTTLLALLAVIGVGTTLGIAGYQAIADKPSDAKFVVVLPAQAKPKAAAPAVQKTDERIVGTWRYTKGITDGTNLIGKPFLSIAWLTFHKDGTMDMNFFNQPKVGTYKVSGPGKIDSLLGIGLYQFDGNDRLTLCVKVGKGADKRPTEFSANEGTGQLLLTLERAKPGEYKPAPEELAKIKGSTENAGEVAQRIVSRQNLIVLGLAMHGYHDVHKAFPAHAIYSKDGKTPLLSWRVAILPSIWNGEYEELYREFKLDESWDSTHNKKLIAKMPKIYASLKPNDKSDGKTYYQVFTGPKTAFDGNKKTMRIDRGLDGLSGAELSNTAFMTEAKDPVIWTKPADIVVPQDKDKMPAIGGLFAVLFGDGSVRTIPREITPAGLRALVIRKGERQE